MSVPVRLENFANDSRYERDHVLGWNRGCYVMLDVLRLRYEPPTAAESCDLRASKRSKVVRYILYT